jgi:adenylate cyclase
MRVPPPGKWFGAVLNPAVLDAETVAAVFWSRARKSETMLTSGAVRAKTRRGRDCRCYHRSLPGVHDGMVHDGGPVPSGCVRRAFSPAAAPPEAGPSTSTPMPAIGDRPRRRLRRRWTSVLLAAQAVAAVVLLCREFGWLQPAELAVYDRLVVAWAGHEQSDAILLVTATEADIGRWGWPLRDEHLAELLGRLTGWDARAVGVDIYRDRPLPPGDRALAELLERHPEIFWVSKLPGGGEHGSGVLPPPVLAGSPRAVLADVVADTGGVVRRGLLAAADPRSGRTVRTLGAALAERHAGDGLRAAGDDVAFGGGRVALLRESYGPYAQVDAEGYQTLLDFRGGRDRFRRVGLAEIMDDPAAAALVSSRLVLVGTGAASVKDSFATPLSAGRHGGEGPLLGVALHAHLADQLIRIHAGEAASRTALPRAADAAIVWAVATAAAAAGLALPSSGLAFAAMLAGLGLIGSAAYAAFGAGLILPAVPALLAWISAGAAAVWVLHGIGLREKLRLKRSFEHYLDPRVIQSMLASEALPGFGGERRVVSVLFTDVAGFTSMAEGTPAERVASLLGDYFDGVCAAVLACGGLVSVFLGDGMLALFGAPNPQHDHADRAVDAALRIDAFARRFAEEQRARGVAWGATRIGVHTGVALVGNIGTRARLSYGAIGDVVNTASRLEGLNKRIGTRVAVSGETAGCCARHRFRPVGEFVLAGRRDALSVATPLTPAEAADPQRAQRYEAAYAALRASDPGTQAGFLALQREDPDDPCVAFHCARLAAGESGIRMVMGEK